jgi:uncharacterized protein (TIGR02145 family)
MKKLIFTAGIIALMSGAALNAQVTIGYDKSPEPFSVLELVSNSRGLRLPQMTTEQREDLVFTGHETEAMGLTIFNLDNLCVETWNGNTWISACMDCDGLTFPALQGSYSLCSDDKISNLTDRVGGNVSWYDAPTDGTKYASDAALNAANTYYGELGIGNCKNSEPRTPVTVVLGDCSIAPTNGLITTFTNVMYDFQKQTLQSYNTDGVATTYQWQVCKTSTGTYSNISDAPNSPFYTIPVDFAHTSGLKDAYNTYSDTLYFKCVLTNPIGTATTTAFAMLFINTTTNGQSSSYLSGYGELNGVKYLTLKSGTSGTLNVALTNLGGNDNNDAGDLGDFYQWGRVADGHQKTGWSKNSSHVNQILPMDGSVTSAVIDYKDGETTPSYDASTHQVATGKYFSKFIYSTGSGTANGDYDWYYDSSNGGHGDGLWGTASGNSRTHTVWDYPDNNPCPSGWHVPSRWNFWDLYKGDGSGTLITSGNYNGTTNNNWVWRGASTNAAGGAIITNTSTGAKVYLSAAGERNYTIGELTIIGSHGRYWSSTYGRNYSYVTAYTSSYLGFDSDNVYAGFYIDSRGYGRSVRCVAE